MLLISTILSAQTANSSWDYPIGPGSSEWENCDNFIQRLSLYNIPESQLTKMKTEDLVHTCLKHPELRIIFTRNSLQQGYEFLRDHFNGLQELEKRQDAGKHLLFAYSKIRHDDVSLEKSDVDKGRFMQGILNIELILSQKSIINNMSKADQSSLISQATSSYENVVRLFDYYGTFPLEMPTRIMGQVLLINKEANPELNKDIYNGIIRFINNSNASEYSVWELVYNISKGTSNK